jgi:hypothetical protein
MRVVRMLSMLLCVLAFVSLAAAGEKALGIRNEYRVTFVAPIRVGTALLPAGDYKILHTMEGQDHIMVFQPVRGNAPDVKVKCTLVPLAQKADHDRTTYELSAGNERVLQELVFRGDRAKHVF